jgi:hypothetical protein
VEKTDWGKLVQRMILWQWVIIAAGILMGLGIWLIALKHLPPQVPLFYSRPWGEEQLVGTSFLWLPLVLTLVTGLLTAMAVNKFIQDRVLAAILMGSGITTEIILVLAVLRTVILVS